MVLQASIHNDDGKGRVHVRRVFLTTYGSKAPNRSKPLRMHRRCTLYCTALVPTKIKFEREEIDKM